MGWCGIKEEQRMSKSKFLGVNIPEELYNWLRKKGKEQKRNLTQQVHFLLDEAKKKGS
jgi:hypothetical protein